MKQDSAIGYLNTGELMVISMFRATTESSFTLLRGVPGNELGRIDDYFWTEVIRDGAPVKLSLATNNPLVINGNEMPGVYKLRNDGFEDEQAVVDMTVFKLEA